MPPEASTGSGLTASTVAGSSFQIEVVPRTWPPASNPCAITASTPASAAASASSTEPTWIITLTPWRCAGSIYGAGSPQNRITAPIRNALAAATMSVSNSRSPSSLSPMMMLIPIGMSVSLRVFAIRLSISPTGIPLTPRTPKPPALDTAEASSGPAAARSPRKRSGSGCPAAHRSACADHASWPDHRRGLRPRRDLLDRPRVAVGVGEVDERSPGMHLDLIGLDSAAVQFLPDCLDVLDHDLKVFLGARRH